MNIPQTPQSTGAQKCSEKKNARGGTATWHKRHWIPEVLQNLCSYDLTPNSLSFLFDALSNMKPARNHPLDYPLSECLFRGLCNFNVTGETGSLTSCRESKAAQAMHRDPECRRQTENHPPNIHPITESLQMNLKRC